MLVHRVVTICTGAKVADLPPDLRAAFGVEETQAFENSSLYFRALADRCPWEPLQGFLGAICDQCHWAILLGGREAAYEVWFGFSIANPHDLCLIRLAQQEPLPGCAPEFLTQFYTTVGGIRLGDDAVYCGWLPVKEFRPMSDTLARRDDPLPRGAAYMVMTYGDGSGAGYCSTGDGLEFTAEGNRIEAVDLEGRFAQELPRWLDREYWS